MKQNLKRLLSVMSAGVLAFSAQTSSPLHTKAASQWSGNIFSDNDCNTKIGTWDCDGTTMNIYYTVQTMPDYIAWRTNDGGAIAQSSEGAWTDSAKSWTWTYIWGETVFWDNPTGIQQVQNAPKEVIIHLDSRWEGVNANFLGNSNFFGENTTLDGNIKYISGDSSGDNYTKQITLPETLLAIGGETRSCGGAFQDFTALETITIPKSVQLINPNAFAGCESLREITILNPDCEILGTNTTICNHYFKGCDGSGTFTGTIRGYSGSTAESYANKYGYNFESIGENPEKTGLPEQPELLGGDYNGDGAVSVADAVLLARVVSEDDTLATGQITGVLSAEPDVDGDGFVTVTDVCAFLHTLIRT